MPATIDETVTQTREYERLLSCVHCGLCLSACPTYNELGVEMDSPRGRIYLIRSFMDGKIPFSEAFTDHLSLCLGCRACETACPSGVHFGEILEWGRAVVEERMEHPPLTRFIRSLAFNRLLPSPRLLRLVALGLRLYQISGISTFLRSTGLLPEKLARLDDLSPRIPPWSMRRPLDEVTPAFGPHHHRVGFLSGCIMSIAFDHINRATLRLLSVNGCEVVTPPAQTCCGALHIHNGEREKAVDLAKAMIDTFEDAGVDAVITNSAGCGSTMKEYGSLLYNDPGYADRAAAFSRKVKDITEFLVEHGFEKPAREIRKRIIYDDPCHLQHGQKITVQPRTLLRAIPGIELVPHRGADQCCGSAGIYNLVHNDLSMRFLDQKMRSIAAAQPDIIVTGNPGCLIQLQAGVRRAGLNAEVLHTVELLDHAYGGSCD